jgi:hypothetical protein
MTAQEIDAQEMTERSAGVDAGGHKLEKPPLEQRLESRLFDIHRKIKRPDPVFYVAGVGISTAGNLTAISGPPKAAKTTFVSAMMAAAMIQDPDAKHDLLGVASCNPRKLAMIHFDTEQSLYDHHDVVMRILARARIKEPPSWYRSYCLTGFSVPDLQDALRLALEKGKANFGGVHSVFLDGAADFVDDVNNPKEANPFVAKLHAAAIEYDCPIIGIIHENPNGGKTRGHLGSQLERKAESNLKLEKSGEVTLVWSEKNRRAPITKDKGPAFVWSDEHLMHISADVSRRPVRREKALPIPNQIAAMNLHHFLSTLPKKGASQNEVTERLEHWLPSEDSPSPLSASRGTIQKAITLLLKSKKLRSERGLYFKGSNA